MIGRTVLFAIVMLPACDAAPTGPRLDFKEPPAVTAPARTPCPPVEGGLRPYPANDPRRAPCPA